MCPGYCDSPRAAWHISAFSWHDSPTYWMLYTSLTCWTRAVCKWVHSNRRVNMLNCIEYKTFIFLYHYLIWICCAEYTSLSSGSLVRHENHSLFLSQSLHLTRVLGYIWMYRQHFACFAIFKKLTIWLLKKTFRMLSLRAVIFAWLFPFGGTCIPAFALFCHLFSF